MTDFALTENLDIGQTFTQEGVEEVFGTNFGFQFKGITLRREDKGRYIILLSNDGEIYDDDLSSEETFTYVGEGVPEKGDQQRTAANQALIDADTELIPIYLFTSQEGIDEYEYRGLVNVEDWDYVSDGERMVYRFTMRRLGVSSWHDYSDARREIEALSREEPTRPESEPTYTTTRAKMRSAAFARIVKRQYENICAVCGAHRVTPEGRPEVEAAHIYPKSENGKDDIRNGIALCRFHHWAFDAGWFSLTDESVVTVNRHADREPPQEIRELDGRELSEPIDSELAPHPIFLEGHRRLHGFQ